MKKKDTKLLLTRRCVIVVLINIRIYFALTLL